MKTIYRIARTELSLLFYSPIAWLLMIVFIVQCGLQFTNQLTFMLAAQQTGGFQYRMMSMNSWTSQLLGHDLFNEVMDKAYLYIPLLTMGLISREVSSGTIKLLYTSPIRVRDIVFGKFLGMMIYNLLLVGIASLFVVVTAYTVVHADCGQAVAGLLGLYLLLCTYSAIGIFVSALTSHQVAAAIGTLVIFAALNYVGLIWQDIDFVRDLTYFLSIAGRAEQMLTGLITTKDVLYFLVIIYMALGFTIYKMDEERKSLTALFRWGRYGMVFATAMVAGFLFSRPGWIGYADTTADKSKTATTVTQELLKKMEGEGLEVNSYINLLDHTYMFGAPGQRNRDRDRWDLYNRFKPDIQMNYTYYYDSVFGDLNRSPADSGLSLPEMGQRYARINHISLSRFETPEEIHKQVDLSPESNRYVMQMKYKGRQTFLRIFDDFLIFPEEAEVSAGLKRLVDTVRKIGFLADGLERSILKAGDKDLTLLFNMKGARASLVNQGYDVEDIHLSKGDIPSDITTLVIADPQVPYDTASVNKILKYIADGGNLLIAGEPGKQAVLNPLLQTLGVRLMDGMLVQKSQDFAADFVLAKPTSEMEKLSKDVRKADKENAFLSMPNATGLAYDGNGVFTITPLAMSDEKLAWIRKKYISPGVGNSGESKPNDGDGLPTQGTLGGGLMNAQMGIAKASKMEPRIDDSRFGGTSIVPANGQVLPVNQGSTSSAPPPPQIEAEASSSKKGKSGAPQVVNPAPPMGDGRFPVQQGSDSTQTIMINGRPMVVHMGHAPDSFQRMTPEEQMAHMRASVQGQVKAVSGTPPPGTVSAMPPAQADSGSAGAVGQPTSAVPMAGAPAAVGKVLVPAGRGAVRRPMPDGMMAKHAGSVHPDATVPSNNNDFSPALGDLKGAVPTVIGLTRTIHGKEQRIVVTGDADFFSNVEVSIKRPTVSTQNIDFAIALVSWLNYDLLPVDVSRPKPKDIRLKLTDSGLSLLKTVFLWVLPGILLALGTILLVRRKRK